MLREFEDDILIEMYLKAVNSNIEDDRFFDNFIDLLKTEIEKRGLLKEIS